MSDVKQSALAILEQLNLDYNHADVCPKREGTWLCVSACAIAPGA